MIPWLNPSDPFPPVAHALLDPAGLLAAGADLSPIRLIDAYSHGIFPWYSEGQPILWWSTDPRMVLFTNEFKISKSFKKTLKQVGIDPRIEVRVDHAFDQVIQHCSQPRSGQDGTWITPAMMNAYGQLHELGFAHSVEVWVNQRLVGGLYGIAIGKMFYGESMFALVTDASKIALAHLVAWLRANDFPMIDCQQQTAHLATLGARPVARKIFANKLESLTVQTNPIEWPKRFDVAISES